MLTGRAKPAARWKQGRHLPGSASSARGSNTAGGPPHHLLPPPWPRRRLPTAPAAPPTDTTVGARPPSTRRGPEIRRDGSRAQPVLRPLGSARGPTPRAEALGAWQGWVAAAVGFVIVDSAFPPQSTPGNSQPGEGRPRRLRRSGSRWAAGTGAARPASVVPNWQLVCPSLTLEGISVLAVDRPKVSATFWPRQTDPAKPGAAPTGEPEAEE